MKEILDKYNLLEGSVLVKHEIAGDLVDCWFECGELMQHRCLEKSDFLSYDCRKKKIQILKSCGYTAEAEIIEAYPYGNLGTHRNCRIQDQGVDTWRILTIEDYLSVISW